MEGIMFGVEDGIAITIIALCFVLFAWFIIIFILWRKEVNERERKSEKSLEEVRNLLEDIKSSFSQEIFLAVGQIVKTMDGIISDFERGKCFVILNSFTSELLKGFSGNILSDLCNRLDMLGMEIESGAGIKNIHSENDGEKIGNCISSISGSVKDTEAFISDYKVKSFQDAINQCYARDKIIESLRYNIEKLRQCVAGLKLNKSKEE